MSPEFCPISAAITPGSGRLSESSSESFLSEEMLRLPECQDVKPDPEAPPVLCYT
jgi:hypothetical protein